MYQSSTLLYTKAIQVFPCVHFMNGAVYVSFETVLAFAILISIIYWLILTLRCNGHSTICEGSFVRACFHVFINWCEANNINKRLYSVNKNALKYIFCLFFLLINFIFQIISKHQCLLPISKRRKIYGIQSR